MSPAGVRVILTSAIVLLLGPSIAQAQSPLPTADATFAVLTVAGAGEVEAGLAALSLPSTERETTASVTLAADKLIVRTSFEQTRSSALDRERVDSGVRRLDMTDARLTGDAGAQNSDLRVFAAPGSANVTLASSRLSLRPSIAHATVEQRWVESSLPSLSSSTRDTLVIENLDAPTVIRVTGSFVVVAWEWEFASWSPTASRFLTSGVSASVPEPLDLAGHAASQQLYLHVQDGTFELRGIDSANPRIWVRDVRLATLESADARIDGLTPDEQSPLRRHLGTTGTWNALELNARNGVGVASFLGTAGPDAQASTRSLMAPAGNAWFAPIAVVVGAAVAIPGCAVSVRAARQRLESYRFTRLEDASEAGDADAALRHANKLRNSTHYREDAALLRVEALVRLARFDEASTVLETLDAAPAGHWSAAVELLRAYLQAMKGDDASAAASLARCLGRSADFYDEIWDNASFTKARSMPAVRAALAQLSDGRSAR